MKISPPVLVLFTIATLSCSSQRKYPGSRYIPLKKFKGDTSAYVKHNFVDNQDNYLGKNIAYILQHWNIPVKSYISVADQNEAYIRIYLCQDNANIVDRNLETDNVVKALLVQWKAPLPFDKTAKLDRKTQQVWTKEAADYYGKCIITQIIVSDYLKRK